jgi:hypothetical protein
LFVAALEKVEFVYLTMLINKEKHLFQKFVAAVAVRNKFQTVFYVAKETSSFEDEKRTAFLTFTYKR